LGIFLSHKDAQKAQKFLCLFLAFPALAAMPQNLDPLIGTWRLDIPQSTFPAGPPPYKRVTTRIERWGDGIRVVYDMVGLRGGVTHWEWSGKVDGTDHPLRGVEEVITNAYTRIDDRRYTLTTKVDGRITTVTNITVTTDGRGMTATSNNSTAIYKRQ
jgi:hypothetical protein